MTDAAARAGGGGFSPRVVAAIIIVGVVAFGAFLVLSSYGPALRSGDDGRAHALSRSAVGYAGMVRLLRAQGMTVTTSRSPPPVNAPSLWILTPSTGAELEQALRNRTGPILVVLPKWLTMPSLRQRGWATRVGQSTPDELNTMLRPMSPALSVARAQGTTRGSFGGTGGRFSFGTTVATGSIEGLQTLAIAGDGETPLEVELADAQGRILLARLPEPRRNIAILSDPDLLNTIGIRDINNAAAGVTVIRTLSGGRGVTFDLTLAGFERGRGLLRTALEPPFLAATLCFVGAAIFMGLHAAARFGPRARTQRVFALGKRALAENAAGLIALAGREARLMPAYAADTRTSVVRDTGAPRALEGEALDAFLDRMGAQLNTTDRWSALNQDAQNTAHPLSIAQRLWRWRTEMTRGRR